MKDNLARAVECGLLLATGLALSQLKLFQLPSGGSVSLGSFPILLIAARRGMKVGIIAGGLMGMLLLAERPFIVSVTQFLLDYPIAFGMLGFSGIFKWDSSLKSVFSVTLGSFLRLLCHVIAGVVFFAKPDLPMDKVIIGSLIYNCGHMIPETILCASLAGYLATRHTAMIKRQD